MATLSTERLTLVDVAKRTDRSGKIADIAELLAEKNEILQSAVFREGNLPTGHRVTQRTGLPTSYWRLINKGVPSSKSTTAQVDESTGILVCKSTADVDLVELEGNESQVRMDEAEAAFESLSQEMAQTVFYGSNASPEEFVGLSNRYNDLSGGNAQNIISAGGTGADNTSIWLIGWGRNKCEMIYPKGSQAGIEHTPMGKQLIDDADGNSFIAYVDEWKWKAGIALCDWRYAVRIANIDVSVVKADTDGSTTNVIEYMLRAIHRLPSLTNCKPVFYCNRDIREMLDIQAQNKSNVYLTAGEEEGRMKTTLRGIPVQTVDQILSTEAQVS